MSRRHLTFSCEGETLIVSGGNETRAGAFSGQAQLAARIAAEGYPVFRFDRRGVGDSTGKNHGFRDSGPDILAAIAAFRAQCPQMQRMVAFGNCDAASALMLLRGDMCDALVLSNPWTFDEEQSDAMPAEAIRSRYAEKLKNPREIWRLLTGDVSFSKLAKGLAGAARSSSEPTSLAEDMAAGLDAATKPHVILIAGNDRTGQAFAGNWQGSDETLLTCEGASHAYVEPHAREWLEQQIVAMLRG
jgi:exosortase A-associated hydrolase 1